MHLRHNLKADPRKQPESNRPAIEAESLGSASEWQPASKTAAGGNNLELERAVNRPASRKQPASIRIATRRGSGAHWRSQMSPINCEPNANGRQPACSGPLLQIRGNEEPEQPRNVHCKIHTGTKINRTQSYSKRRAFGQQTEDNSEATDRKPVMCPDSNLGNKMQRGEKQTPRRRKTGVLV